MIRSIYACAVLLCMFPAAIGAASVAGPIVGALVVVSMFGHAGAVVTAGRA